MNGSENRFVMQIKRCMGIQDFKLCVLKRMQEYAIFVTILKKYSKENQLSVCWLLAIFNTMHLIITDN